MNIYQIEITNKCQFKCDYCPRTTSMTRKVGTMSNETIDRISEIITSDSVRLHHYGESLLELDTTLYATNTIKTKNPNIMIELNTNGELLTPETAKRLFDAGISKINLSYHMPTSIQHLKYIDESLRSKIEVMKIAHLSEIEKYKEELKDVKSLGYSVILKQLRDLGQVTADLTVERDDWKKCSFIVNDEFVVLYDGSIGTCCEVYNADDGEVLGTVFDTVLPIKNRKIDKCKTCRGYGNDGFETEKIDII